MTTGKTVVHINIGERQIEDIQGIDVIVTTKDNTKILYDKWYMTEQEDPKTGHWIDIDDYESECSECGHREPNERFIFEDINFCAKCGARMVEPQESDNCNQFSQG